MKIAKVEQFFPRKRTRLVKITTDNGLVGWGESTLEGRPKGVVGVIEELSGYLVGKVRELDGLHGENDGEEECLIDAEIDSAGCDRNIADLHLRVIETPLPDALCHPVVAVCDAVYPIEHRILDLHLLQF